MSEYSHTQQGPFIDADLLPPVPGLNEPTVTERTFSVNDDDASVCRLAPESEIRAAHVDTNIAAIEPIQPDPWTLDPSSIDSQPLRITYTHGLQYQVLLGAISMDAGGQRADFRKYGGLIFPVDASGQPMFDATNTPNLAAIRRNFHEQLAQRAQERLEIAEIVNAFAQAVSALGNRADIKF